MRQPTNIVGGTCPPSAMTGSPSAVAVMRLVVRFDTPGPEVVAATPGLPVSQPIQKQLTQRSARAA